TDQEPAARPRLDPTQQAVVDHPGGPLLVLAGPGTGKTTTIVEAVAARIDAGIDPEQILVLTFSRKAAAELRTRITGRVGQTIREPLARTFHSYAYGVLRRAALLRGEAPERLAVWGREAGHELWVPAAAFQEQYEQVSGFWAASRGDASGYDPA